MKRYLAHLYHKLTMNAWKLHVKETIELGKNRRCIRP